MNPILDEVRLRQGGWSETANVLKRDFETQRKAARVLSLIGAVLATTASHFDGTIRACIVGASTLTFAYVAFLTKRSQGAATAQPWVHARALSESLKRLAYTYAARGKGFSELTKRDEAARSALADVTKAVEAQANGYLGDVAGKTPQDDLTPAGYLERRVDVQIGYYQKNAETYRSEAKKLRAWEFWLAFATVAVTAIAGWFGKTTTLGGDFTAFAAVLTTISGAILAHIEASKFDFLVSTFTATALRLRDMKLTLPQPLPDIASPEWAKFVGQCEQHIATENGSWMQKLGKS